jgi:hypothetical protein
MVLQGPLHSRTRMYHSPASFSYFSFSSTLLVFNQRSGQLKRPSSVKLAEQVVVSIFCVVLKESHFPFLKCQRKFRHCAYNAKLIDVKRRKKIVICAYLKSQVYIIKSWNCVIIKLCSCQMRPGIVWFQFVQPNQVPPMVSFSDRHHSPF